MLVLILIFLCCNFYSFCSSTEIDNLIKIFQEDKRVKDDLGTLLSEFTKKTNIASSINAKCFINQTISEKIIKYMNEPGVWSKNNIHLLLLLDPDAQGYQDALEKNIQLLIEELTEKVDIASFINAKYFIKQTISAEISEEIIKYMNQQRRGWSKNNIHLLLLLHSYAEGYKEALKKNIQLLIQELTEKTNIASYGNAKYFIKETISEEIIKYMNEKGGLSKNNIHLLLLLHPYAEGYQEALEKNIQLLIKELTEKTNIASFINAEYFINQTISEKIIKYMNEQRAWSKNNIHLLLLLNPHAPGYEEVLTEDNIKLLIEELTEKTDIAIFINAKYFIKQTISEKIIEYMNEKKPWSKNNIHLLLLLHNNVRFIDQIAILRRVKKSCRFWHVSEKYRIQNRINFLLEQNNYPLHKESLKEYSNSQLEDLCQLNFSNLDISYAGMCPFGKLIVASGIVASGINTVLFKKNIISNPLSYIVWGLASGMVVVPSIVNQINRFKDEKKFFPVREQVLKNLLGILNKS